MQVAYAQLNSHLQAHASKGVRSLYTLHGDEALLQQEALDDIRTLARTQGYTEVCRRDNYVLGECAHELIVMVKPIGSNTVADYLAEVPRDRPDAA